MWCFCIFFANIPTYKKTNAPNSCQGVIYLFQNAISLYQPFIKCQIWFTLDGEVAPLYNVSLLVLAMACVMSFNGARPLPKAADVLYLSRWGKKTVIIHHYILRWTKLKGVYWFHRIVSALYLLQYSPDPFHIYIPYQATSEGASRVKFFFRNSNILTNSLKICNFDFVLFWLGIPYEPLYSMGLGSNSMGNHGASGGYPQNAGILVALVLAIDPGLTGV